MPLLLTEADVKAIFTMPMALECVEASFRRLADGTATVHPRRRLRMAPKGVMNYMAASDTAGGYMGLKIYTVAPGAVRFLVPLFSSQSGELLAWIEADYLGQMRTGAATGVASKVLARPDAHTLGMIGTGYQARTQLEAVATAKKLEMALVFGRDQARREKFASEMSARLRIPVVAAKSAEETIRSADIVITSTTASKPVLEGRWLKPGTHINAIGSNFPEKQELDVEAVGRCDVIASDCVEQAKIEAGDLIQAFGADTSRWKGVVEMSDIIGGKVPGRTNQNQITLFKSAGIAIEDVVSAGRIYEIAKERGMGRDVPMWQESSSPQA